MDKADGPHPVIGTVVTLIAVGPVTALASKEATMAVEQPTRKTVDEAINTLGPWLSMTSELALGGPASQVHHAVDVLRQFAMATVMHPDYLARVIGSLDGRGGDDEQR